MKRLLTIALMFGLVAPASAQVAGSRLNRQADKSDAKDALVMWSQCAADIEANWARDLLAALPTSDAERVIWDKHFGWNDRCLTSDRLLMDNKKLTFSSASARGEIAGYLARRDIGANRQPTKGAATAWLRDGLAALGQNARYDRSVLIGHQFALCLADEHWAETRAFVLAEPDSKAEKAALAALSPKLGQCMTSGARLNLNKPVLRVLLGEAAYHALRYTPRTLGVAR